MTMSIKSSTFFQSRRFIALMACLSGLTALGIDAVLPLFPHIIEHYSLPREDHNRIQQVVFVYMLGFALLQLVFGVLADVWGRKRLLLIGIAIYSFASILVIFSPSFEWLLVARFLQGAGMAAPRVLSIAIIRDVVSGREMSKILSFVTMVFLAVPAFAPMLGQSIVFFFPWQMVFIVLMLMGGGTMFWVHRGLPETLAVSERIPLRIGKLKLALSEFLGHAPTILYLLMIGLLFAMLMTHIGLAEQILQKETYKLGHWFPLFFALIVVGMIFAARTNAKVVMRVGMHRLILIALTLSLVVDIIMLLLVVVGGGVIPLWLYICLMILHFFGFGLAMPNLNTLAIMPYHHISGTASALIGMLTTVMGVGVGQFISHFFDGSLYAPAIGMAICSLLAFLLNLWNRCLGKNEH